MSDSTADILEAVASDSSIPNRVRSRRAILQAVLDAAASHRGRVTAAWVREAIVTAGEVVGSLEPTQFGAVTSSLTARGWLSDTGLREKSGNSSSRNAERDMPVYRLNGRYVVTPDGQIPPKLTDSVALAAWEGGEDVASPQRPAGPVRPPFPYFGGKQRIADQIVAFFPEHEHYVEPFCGSLSVFAAKAPSRLETVNDLDGDVMTFWRVLRDSPEELIRACALTPHARAEHAGARHRDGVDDLERARRVWVSLTQGRAGQLMRTGWRYYIDRASSSIGMPGYLDAYVERMEGMAGRLHAVSLESRPALEVIEAYGRYPGTLLYVDPPYVGGSRGTTYAYRHEMRSEDQHRELAAALQSVPAAVVLSGYRSPLYDELYGDWWSVEITASTQQGGAARRTGARTEILWSNRPLASTDVFPIFQQARA